MTGGIIGLAIRRPIGVAVLSLLVCVLGVVAVLRLPVDLLPEVDFPRISIVTRYEGVGPEEIENLLTRPIERAVSPIQGVTTIDGESAEGLSRVQLQFDWGTNLDGAVNDVRSALDRLRATMPEDAEQPTVLKFDISATPIATLGLSGAGDPRRLRTFADEVLTRRLERIPGVASVQINGGRVREVAVELDAARLVALGVSAAEIVQALGADNENVSAGDMREAGREVLVRTVGELRTAADVEAVVVAQRDGRPILVRDLAKVTDGFQEIRSEQWVDGEPGIVARVSKQAGHNTIEVVERLRREVDALNAEQEGRARVIVVHESATYIRSAVTNVQSSAAYGAALAVLILLLFLRDLRATFVIALAIPFSVTATFALMYFAGLSLNLISFGGLALGIGMLVDNAIVILESIYARHEEGLPPLEAAERGAREVAGAVVAGTLTTLAVFAPVVFLAGFAGIFFAEMALVVVFSLACSLVVAVTLVPSLAARLLVRRERGAGLVARADRALERGLDALGRGYARALRATLGRPWLTLAACGVLMLGAVRLWSNVHQELMPQTDEGVIDLDFELPVGTPVERSREVVLELERRIRAAVAPEEIANVVSSAGPDNPYRPGGGHEGEVEVTLVPVSARSRSGEAIIAAIREAIAGMPDLSTRIRQRTTNPLQRFMRGSQGERLVVEIRGHDLEAASALAERVQAVMTSVRGIADARIDRVQGLAERSVVVSAERAADVGLTRRQVAEALETYVLGRVATRLRDRGEEVDVRVTLRQADRRETAQLEALPILTPTGVVPLSAVADVGVRRGPGSIARQGQQRIVTIAGGLTDRPLGEVVAELEARLAGVERPSDFSIEVAGEAREQDATFAGLGVGVLLAILLVFGVMAVQFESIVDPLLVMSAIPFGFVGVALTLVATGTTFSLNAFLGCIVLVGIAVNNAIVLVDAAQLLGRDRGLDPARAMLEAGRQRLRPILMTTSTTVLGVLPVALAFGEGAEIQAPLARVVAGGLLVSTFVTLVLLPVLYVLAARRGHATGAAAEAPARGSAAADGKVPPAEA